MIAEELKRKLRGFLAHGVEFADVVGGQVRGTCPFTGKERKFFVNAENLLWDSKTAGLSGNFDQFLEAIGKMNATQMPKAKLTALAKDRGLPVRAFAEWEVGWSPHSGYTVPVRDLNGNVKDLRRFWIGKKSMTTPNAENSLLGADRLTSAKDADVYLCEGEWDAIALKWLLGELGEKGVVVATPGANTFKDKWLPWFRGRNVHCLYDNDEAGAQGELLAEKKLRNVAKSVSYIEWPSGSVDGFDVRDWILLWCFTKKAPRKGWRLLQALFIDKPRREGGKPVASQEGGKEREQEEKAVYRSAEEVISGFKRWLLLPNPTVLPVVFGSVLANRLQGDPLWLFLVAPPGGMKSEILMSLGGAKEIHPMSSLTPHALVSGASWLGGSDPSLVPLLDGKVLIVKDFTTTLVMNPAARDEIFGQLRDLYDGKFTKQFGNGIIRDYNSKFGIIAGVTPNIDAFSALHSGLGERFLKFRFERSEEPEQEKERILRAMKNTNKEVSMREELVALSAAFLASREVHNDLVEVVTNGEWGQRIVSLAMTTSRLRGAVSRDKFNPGMVLTKASHELGTRLAKQLVKLACGVAAFYGKDKMDDEVFSCVAQVGLDSCPDTVEEVVGVLFRERDKKEGLKTKEIEELSTSLTLSTILRTVQNLEMLGIVNQIGVGRTNRWKLARSFDEMLSRSGAFIFR